MAPRDSQRSKVLASERAVAEDAAAALLRAHEPVLPPFYTVTPAITNWMRSQYGMLIPSDWEAAGEPLVLAHPARGGVVQYKPRIAEFRPVRTSCAAALATTTHGLGALVLRFPAQNASWSPAPLLDIMHQIAHLLAWRTHDYEPPHGPSFARHLLSLYRTLQVTPGGGTQLDLPTMLSIAYETNGVNLRSVGRDAAMRKEQDQRERDERVLEQSLRTLSRHLKR